MSFIRTVKQFHEKNKLIHDNTSKHRQNLFREKFKFRGFTKAFTNFAKHVIAFIFAKFKYFAKQIIYLESPDHVLQNEV